MCGSTLESMLTAWRVLRRNWKTLRRHNSGYCKLSLGFSWKPLLEGLHLLLELFFQVHVQRHATLHQINEQVHKFMLQSLRVKPLLIPEKLFPSSGYFAEFFNHNQNKMLHEIKHFFRGLAVFVLVPA